jgi:Ca2+-dependent lipid-binding protein
LTYQNKADGTVKFELTLTDLGQGKQLPFTPGTLTIHPASAELIVDSELFSKMDPYIAVDFKGAAQAKTSTAQSAGKSPTWTDKLTF